MGSMFDGPDVGGQIICFEQLDPHGNGDQTVHHPGNMLHVWVGKTFRWYLHLRFLTVSAHVGGKTCAVSIR